MSNWQYCEKCKITHDPTVPCNEVVRGTNQQPLAGEEELERTIVDLLEKAYEHGYYSFNDSSHHWFEEDKQAIHQAINQARIDEVESMGVLAVDHEEILSLLAKRLESLQPIQEKE